MKQYGCTTFDDCGYANVHELGHSWRNIASYSSYDGGGSLLTKIQEDGWDVLSVTPIQEGCRIKHHVILRRDMPEKPYRPANW